MFWYNCDYSDIYIYIIYFPRDLVKIGFCYQKQDNFGWRIFIIVQGWGVWQRYYLKTIYAKYTRQVKICYGYELWRVVPDNNGRYLHIIWLIVDCSTWFRLELNTKIGSNTTHHTGTFVSYSFLQRESQSFWYECQLCNKLIVLQISWAICFHFEWVFVSDTFLIFGVIINFAGHFYYDIVSSPKVISIFQVVFILDFFFWQRLYFWGHLHFLSPQVTPKYVKLRCKTLDDIAQPLNWYHPIAWKGSI